MARDVVAVSAVTGLGAALAPAPTAIAITAALCAMTVGGPGLRVAVFTVGGMLALGGANVDVREFAYLAATAAFSTAAFVSALDRRVIRPTALWATLGTASTVAIGVLTGLGSGNASADVARDAFTYVLPLAVLPMALDGSRAEPRTLERVLVVAGLLSSLGFVSQWILNRGIGDIAEVPILHSGVVAGALCAYSLARVIVSERWEWGCIILAGFTAAAPFVTATRSAVLVGAIPASILTVLGGVRAWGIMRRAVGRLVMVTVLALVAFISLLATPIVDESFVMQRLSTLSALSTGATRAGADASAVERQLSVELVREAWLVDELRGQGLGTRFALYRPTRRIHTNDFTIDTSLVLLAKLGVLGAAAIGFLWVSWWRLARPFDAPLSAWSLGLVGFASWVLVTLPFNPIMEDKGLPLGAALLIAGRLSAVAGHRSGGDRSPANGEVALPPRSNGMAGSLRDPSKSIVGTRRYG